MSDESTGEFILYTTEDDKTRVACRFQDETIRLSQALMAELFETTPQNITLHLKALYEDGEIVEDTTCKEYLQVRQEGGRQVRRAVKHYSLEAILAVGSPWFPSSAWEPFPGSSASPARITYQSK